MSVLKSAEVHDEKSQNITVENCKFFGVNLAALMLCCDLKQWNEMGPAKNVVIKNNIFEEYNLVILLDVLNML